MDRLHPHIIANIVQQAVSGPEPQLELLEVCSEFYLVAISILYHAPRITSLSGFRSFSLLTSRPLPDDHRTLSVRDLVRMGHTKLAALRYTRHLCIAIRGIDVHRPHGRLRVTEKHGYALSYALGNVFCRLPYGAMPNLDSLQIGDLRRKPLGPEGRVHLPVAGDMADVFMSRAAPRVWCQHLALVTHGHHPGHDPQLFAEFPPAPILHCHTYPFQQINLFPGTTSYVYIHTDPHDPRPRDPDDPDEPDDPAPADRNEGLAWWLAVNILVAFRQVEPKWLASGDSREKLIKRSRIVIAFATGILKEASLEPDEELRRLREIAVRAVESASSPEDDQPDLKDVTIDVRSGSDMPRCPACRLNVDDIWYVSALPPLARGLEQFWR